jgi:hypothetical protein
MSNSVSQSSVHGQFSSSHASPPSLQRVDLKSAPHADIAKRAYEKYQARGCVHGFDREDWTAANRELIAERSGKHLRLGAG